VKFGFHISIAGGFRFVVERAKIRGCETIQFFSRNPRGWHYNALDEEDIILFKNAVKREGISPIFIHLPYLPNLASSKSQLFKLSVESLVEDLKRSALLEANFLIMHVGSAEEKDKGLVQMAEGINEALVEVKNDCILLLENTAGSGNELGATFEQIRKIIDKIENKSRIGVVFDTAHAFEAGYDLRTETQVHETMIEFDNLIGLSKLFLIHFNDSKTKIGSHSDRHWHISKGEIGKGMGYILRNSLLQNKPFIMETPRTNLKEDLTNMKTVRQLLKRR